MPGWLLQLIVRGQGRAATQAKAHSRAHAGTTAHACSAAARTAASAALPRALPVPPARTGRTRRSLHRNGELGGNRIEIKRLADEIAELNDKLVHMNRPSFHQISGSALGKADLLIRAEQDDIGKNGFHGIADAPRPLSSRRFAVCGAG